MIDARKNLEDGMKIVTQAKENNTPYDNVKRAFNIMKSNNKKSTSFCNMFKKLCEDECIDKDNIEVEINVDTEIIVVKKAVEEHVEAITQPRQDTQTLVQSLQDTQTLAQPVQVTNTQPEKKSSIFAKKKLNLI